MSDLHSNLVEVHSCLMPMAGVISVCQANLNFTLENKLLLTR